VADGISNTTFLNIGVKKYYNFKTLDQRLPTFFFSRTLKQKKEKSRTP